MAALRRNFLPADLEPVLVANGMDGCVAVQASQSADETRFLVGLAQAEPDDFLMRPEVVSSIRQLAAFGFTYGILICPTQFKAALQLVRFVIDYLAKPYIRKGEINRWTNWIAELAR